MRMRFFDIAKKESHKSTFHNFHLGCVVIYNGKIISKASNTFKTHPIQKQYNTERYTDDYSPHSMHAEIAALTKIMHQDINYSRCEVYIYREFKNGNPAMARPCRSCMKMIRELGIKKIHYSTNYGYATEYLTTI